MNDLRYAARQIVRRPAMMAVAVAILSLGIGANTAIFGAIDAAILRAPPYPGADELRIIRPAAHLPAGGMDTLTHWSYPMFEAFRDAEPGLGPVAAYTQSPASYNLETAGEPERARVEIVSSGYFGLLGVTPTVGRFFLPEEDRTPDEAAVAILSHDAWIRFYESDSAVVGRTIRLNTVPFTVVGVARPGFHGLSERADLWVPMMMAPTLTFPRRLTGSLSFWHAVIARAPGPAEAIQARLTGRAAAVATQLPLRDAFGDATLDFVAIPLADARVNPATRAILRVLMAAVAFVLLIVCVNVANLLLTQAARRRRELGVRVALGAGRRHLARTFLVESVLLGMLGGVGGLLVATWVLDLVATLAPQAPAGTADPTMASLRLPVLLFNFTVAALAGAAAGLLPALQVARRGTQVLLQDSARHTGGRGARQILIASELALALVLLTGAALMVRSLDHLRRVDPGFRSAGLLTAALPLPRQTYGGADVVWLLDTARERLAAGPGVEAVSAANCLPLAGGCDNVGMEIRGRPSPSDQPFLPVQMNMVDGGYFSTLGIPLLTGRTFGEEDRTNAPRVAIVNRAAALRYWPGESPVGGRIKLTVGWEDDALVIGVVGDVVGETLGEPVLPMVYLPYHQMVYHANYLVIRGPGNALHLAEPMRAAIRELDPGLPVWDIRTMQARIGESVSDTRFTTTLLALAAGLATLLAALGVFGVMAFTVASRTRELGVRMALGARAHDVLMLVVGQGMRAAAAGIAVGLLGAFVLTRALASQLHGVTARDPVAFAAGAGMLALVALVAAWLPARRAARVDPMEALRHE